jgi:hypothetical protein
MQTAEGKLKNQVRKMLNEAGAWYWMPVPSGYGRSTLDFIGCYHGRFFAIETKAPGKKLTSRQEIIVREMCYQGEAVVFWGDNLKTIQDAFSSWANSL